MTKHLFVCGCPRSGTTLVAEVLNHHPDIVLGIERYGNRFFTESLTPELFEKGRFFNIQPGDTFYSSLDFAPSYALKEKGFEQARYVGDKIPLLFDHFDSLHDKFPNAAIVFCVRNVIDVSSSFQVRRDNPADKDWHDALDGVEAVAQWNRSLEAYAKSRKRMNVFLFDHDIFLADGKRQMKQLIRWLGLAWARDMAAVVARHQAIGQRLLTKRNYVMTGEANRAIMRTAAIGRYRAILKQWEAEHGLPARLHPQLD